MPTSARSSSMSEYRAKSFRDITGATTVSAVSPIDSILIIIDAQNEYADGLLQTADINRTRSAISSLLQTYRKAAEPKLDSNSDPASPTPRPSNIVHVVHSVPEGSPIFTPHTPLANEFPETLPLPTEVVVSKHYPSAFKDTDLHERLQSMGAGGRIAEEGDKNKNKNRKIVLAGYMAHVCVSTTARQAHELGYEVVVAGDAVGDRDIPGAKGEEVTRMVLLELADAFASVVESKDIK